MVSVEEVLLCLFRDRHLLLLATMRWRLVGCCSRILKEVVLDFDFDSQSVSQMDSRYVIVSVVMRPHSLATFGFLIAISLTSECEVVALHWTTCRRDEGDVLDDNKEEVWSVVYCVDGWERGCVSSIAAFEYGFIPIPSADRNGTSV